LYCIVLFWAFGLLLHPFNPQGIIAGSFAFHLLIHFSDDEYLHLPDVRMLQGLLDLISGCTLVVLGNRPLQNKPSYGETLIGMIFQETSTWPFVTHVV
jgi:hypothetical protein